MEWSLIMGKMRDYYLAQFIHENNADQAASSLF